MGQEAKRKVLMQRIAGIVAYEALEAWIGTLQVGYGLWLLLPFNTFTGTGSYRLLGTLVSEELWGWLLLTTGLLYLGFLLRGTNLPIAAMAGVNIVWWSIMLIAFAWAGTMTTGIILAVHVIGGFAYAYARNSHP